MLIDLEPRKVWFWNCKDLKGVVIWTFILENKNPRIFKLSKIREYLLLENQEVLYSGLFSRRLYYLEQPILEN